MMRMIFALVAVGAVILIAWSMFRQAPASDDSPDQNLEKNESEQIMNETQKLARPEVTIDTSKSYTAILHTTEGDIAINLSTKTPVTANNFIYLARSNFYDNTIFHRVMEGFMIQGGDPTGTGTGDPGYKFDDEPFDGEYSRGTVAMANSGRNTNGSQFFIMHADRDLPKDYVIFGAVSEGIEVVDKIATAETVVSMGGEKSKPVNPVKINSVEIIEQ